jgi:hypothetical protein
MRFFVLITLLISAFNIKSQSTPIYGNDIKVTINGFTADAMEPHISPDGNALFFNSLNNGITTSLYYAAKVNDSTFNLVGLMPVVNETVTPYLNAVASLDTADNFYWVSLRGYPGDIHNLHRVRFATSGPTNFGRVYGNFNVNAPGYLIMDAAISYEGDYLYYCNAYFNSCAFGLPCSSRLGVAQKVNDSTFNHLPNTNAIFANVNDTSYIVYAPVVTPDGLELYFTRAAVGVPQTEICVSVRSNTLSAFSTPTVIITSFNNAPEGPSITTNKNILYYHKKSGGVYTIFMRYKSGVVGIAEPKPEKKISVYPNPNSGSFTIKGDGNETILISDQLGQEIKTICLSDKNNFSETLSDLKNGVYFLNGKNTKQKIIVID